ncbi:response regulator transcription factor [Nocardia salmonicida]|uniref:response regulator transcription factor n=1 Tax=Nocardia salmonicida TaxID=53431 RepID=UPI00362B9BAE
MSNGPCEKSQSTTDLPGSSVPLGIAVIEDHSIWVRGLVSVLDQFHVDATVTHYQCVSELIAEGRQWDVVILDLVLDDASTPTNNIVELNAAGHQVLVITSAERPDLVREAARAGVLGIIRKSEPEAVIAESVKTAARHGVVTSVDWAAALDGDAGFVPHLSAREREVLALWASGETAKSVAEMLGLSVNTVNGYIGRIKVKYEESGYPARTKAELREAAQRAGIAPKSWWRPTKA